MITNDIIWFYVNITHQKVRDPSKSYFNFKRLNVNLYRRFKRIIKAV